MRQSPEGWTNNFFSHIYVEHGAEGWETTRRILERFPGSHVIPIKHYKDFFCKNNQDFTAQKKSPKLVLAVNRGEIIYKGSPMCNAFGNEHFYYTSQILNCIYDCEYCYLQGLYPSANLVIFVNMEDTFDKISEMLKDKSLYVCVSYDTDLLALENLTGFCGRWIEYAGANPGLKIEIRTKSANFSAIKTCPVRDNVILAWTLSPQEIVAEFEHRAPSLTNRLKNISAAIDAGYGGRIRLCVDPALVVSGREQEYRRMVKQIFEVVPPGAVLDVSLGLFRLPESHLKIMKKIRPRSKIFAYDFDLEATGFLKELFMDYLPEEKIFS